MPTLPFVRGPHAGSHAPLSPNRRQPPIIRHVVLGGPQRDAAEAFVRAVFRKRYAAEVRFAPNLMLVERDGVIRAAAGWRSAADRRLMLEQYLDEPVDQAVSRLAGQPVARERIVEVGNLAAERAGFSAST